ncbi:histidine kinase [Marinoscillum sp. MHG1-6]|uniref:histidine kinase n=1 Tax=Marinoscillum sp. MHG1-6 TaxID=2959627 RepID=UPI002158001D|nr:sensor histidine kinase [Marinoscillum sp. MHG1-6]
MLFPLPGNQNLVEIEDILVSFSLSILETKSEEELAWAVAKNCISALGFEDCVVYYIDSKSGMLIQKAAHGPKNPIGQKILSPINIPIGQGITGSVAKSGEHILIGDTSKDPRYIVDDAPRLSEICVPIKLDDRVVGVIDCEHSERSFFNEEHLRILNAIARICSIKLSQLSAQQAKNHHLMESHRIKLELAQLQTKVLKSQLNPHFVFNTLNTIQYFLTENDKETALRYLTLFSKLIRYYLGHFEIGWVLLDKELNALKNYLILQELRYGEKFNFTIQEDNQVALKECVLPAIFIISTCEDIIEKHLTGSDLLELEIGFERTENELILQFLFRYSGVEPKKAQIQKKAISWKDQINIFNKLKKGHIRYNTESTMLTDKTQKTYQITIPQNNVPDQSPR